MNGRRVTLAAVLFVLAVVVGIASRGLDGFALFALVLGVAALDVLAPVLAAPVSRRVSLEEACEVVAAEQRVKP